MSKQKVVIFGAGMVGSAAAYAIGLRSVAEEIVLIDRTAETAWGQAADINDAMGIDRNVLVRPGTVEDIETDDIVIITAGAPQQPGQTRMELLSINAEIIRETVRKIMMHGATPYILVVSNPVDVLTYVALKESGLPKNRVFGTGTVLDTARLKSILADGLDIGSRDVDVYILGEHGDSSFSTIETAQVGEIPINEYPGFQDEMAEGVEQKIRERAYRIIEAKKSTYFAIGFVISKIVSALMQSTGTIYPVCSLVEGEYEVNDVVLGLPSVVNREGVKILSGYPLTERQRVALNKSAHIVRESINQVAPS